MKKRKHIAINRALGTVRKYFPNVNKVNDAKHGLLVEVTKNDDRVSRRKSHEGCAMAVACKRAMHLDGVLVSVKTAYLIKNNTATRFLVPERVSREVVSFDRGSGFEPGVYKLEKPYTKLGEGKAHSKSGSSGRHVKHLLTKNIRTVLGSDLE